MPQVVVDITMSLDGFVTGPNPGPGNGLGDGGEPLHRWVFEGTEDDQRILSNSFERTGAVLMGRNTFDVVDAPDGWDDELGFGGPGIGGERPPNIVLTHEKPEKVRLVDAFVFATDGLEAAVQQAREAAGSKDVTLMGASVSAQCLAQGIADEVVIHLAPMVLGSGTPLFSGDAPTNLEQVDVLPTLLATHLHYRVAR